jgi:endonuclease YncB( thermonuclease family)
MVPNGWAVSFRRYSVDYVADEDAARQSHVNIQFDMPWEWRGGATQPMM